MIVENFETILDCSDGKGIILAFDKDICQKGGNYGY